MRLSLIPELSLSFCESLEWVVDAGCVIVVLVSPKLAVIEIKLVESIRFHVAFLSPLTLKDTIPPPADCCLIANSC